MKTKYCFKKSYHFLSPWGIFKTYTNAFTFINEMLTLRNQVLRSYQDNATVKEPNLCLL